MAVKPPITACDVIKTTPNNHPSQVGYDTSAQVSDTSAVDLEKTCWNYMGQISPGKAFISLLALTERWWSHEISLPADNI